MNKRFTLADFTLPLMTSVLTDTAASRTNFQDIIDTFTLYKAQNNALYGQMVEFQKVLCSLAMSAERLSEAFVTFGRAIKKQSDQNSHRARRTASKLHDYFERLHSSLNEVVTTIIIIIIIIIAVIITHLKSHIHLFCFV